MPLWVTGLARGSAVERELKHAGAVQAEHPCLLENFLEFLEATSQRRLAIFLDYDGTLTPIVKNPDRAYMSDQVRCARSPPPLCGNSRAWPVYWPLYIGTGTFLLAAKAASQSLLKF